MLERLFNLLGVHPEERSALQAGRHLRLTHEPDRLPSLDELWQRLDSLNSCVNHGNRRLLDLEFLAWRADLWPLAAHGDAGKELLALGWSWCAEWLTWVGRTIPSG
jgi:hypothetical protein